MTAVASDTQIEVKQGVDGVDIVRIRNGPIIQDGTAYLPPEESTTDTTGDIDYVAVSRGEQCSWFPGQVQAMMTDSMEYPCFSHGFDKVLAELHRRQPNLSYAYTIDNGDVLAYRIVGYESAGLWVDSAGYACLVIMAVFEDGSQEMRLLYSCNLRASVAEVKQETQWCELPGTNRGLAAQAHALHK